MKEVASPYDRIKGVLVQAGYHHFLSSGEKKSFAHNTENTNQFEVSGNKWAHHPKYNRPATHTGVGWKSLQTHLDQFNSSKKENVTTLPGSLGVNPYQWTTAHRDVPPEWLDQEGHPCMIGGRHGTMQIVNGRLICVVNPKESTDMFAAEGKIENPNSSGQGYDSDHARHPLNSTIIKHGYSYSHTTPIHQKDGSVHHKHTYAKGEHKVGTSSHNTSSWETKTSSGSGHSHGGSGASALDKHLASKNRRYSEGEGDMDDEVITEATTLRFSSPSRVQIAKCQVYWDIHRRQKGLGVVKVGPIEGTDGNWYFDVSSHSDNQFLTTSRMNNVLPGNVTVTSGGPVVVQHNASQNSDTARSAILEMVEERIQQSLDENQPDPMKHSIESAGHKHVSSSYYNGRSVHHYSYNYSGKPFEKLATEHGFKKITNDVYKKFGPDGKQTDYLMTRSSKTGHRIEHERKDPTSTYEEGDESNESAKNVLRPKSS